MILNIVVNMSENMKLDNCRICNEKVRPFLDLGRSHPPEEFRTKEELSKPIETFPLGLSYCPNCGEVQLSHEIPPDVMYKQNYFYDYSLTKTGEKHWIEFAELVCKRYNISKGKLVVDVGSNTGKLLEIFKNMNMKILGIDPATKLVRIARKRGIPTIDNYFTLATAVKVVNTYGKASLITCNNVFDHVTNLHEFMNGVVMLLDKPDGIFVIETPYFATFFRTLCHVVYHQQIDYVLVKPFKRLFEANGMEIIDCERISYHGGSIRFYIGFKGQHRVNRRVNRFIREEDALFKNRDRALKSFAKAVLAQRDDMVKLLRKLKKDGNSIGAVGASAKGNVLLFYSGIGPDVIDFITEKSPLKIGRYTPSGIPIVKDSELFKRKPDYAVFLSWNFRKEIFNNVKEYTDGGGKFIIPIPKLRIIK